MKNHDPFAFVTQILIACSVGAMGIWAVEMMKRMNKRKKEGREL